MEAADIEAAVAALRRGEVVAYPTETFYGLGVDAFDEAALGRLRALKGEGRGEKAVSMLIEGPAMLERLVAEIPPAAAELMRRHWPGALTIALPARAGLPAGLVADGCVAIRQSPHPLARALVAGFGGPVTTTSANRAGEPPATTAAAVRAALGDGCTLLDGGATAGGAPSTLVRVRGAEVEILRRGAVELRPG
ncbi:MAG TPA: L-threonylcarbamoyladenylate synthase [Polyangia bacterium]|nr:L-threonylcarbamoyladenylate synthase [Polyangia bacterium]